MNAFPSLFRCWQNPVLRFCRTEVPVPGWLLARGYSELLEVAHIPPLWPPSCIFKASCSGLLTLHISPTPFCLICPLLRLPSASLLPLVPSHFPSCILLFKRMVSSILKIGLLNPAGPQAAAPCFSFLLPVSFVEALVQTPPSLHLALTPQASQSWFQPTVHLKIGT